ncbi:MAG: 5-(carboxyamino)imidazole ribonucleotide synthase [Proteocatella sp.]
MHKEIIQKLNPPSTIGIVGGGQLGRMLVLAAKEMGYNAIILDPMPNSPASQVADEQIIAEYGDLSALKDLAQRTEVLTYEFEHIDVELLSLLEKSGHKIYPSSKTLRLIQNKFVQKNMLLDIGVKVADFRRIDSLEKLIDVYCEFDQKLILKTCTGGYDGKGNMVINDSSNIEDVFKQFENLEIMAEKLVDFTKEVSVIIARNHEGTVFYPVAENIHKNSILINSKVPAAVSIEIQNKIYEICKKIVEELDDYGIFCIEFFIDKQSNVLVNEIAPRPHNSGHYSIEGCITSQFEQLIRIITGMPLGSAKLRLPCVMYNILGNEYNSGKYHINGIDSLLGIEDCHFHLYGKAESKHLKKIGHITVLDESIDRADEKAMNALSMLSVDSINNDK